MNAPAPAAEITVTLITTHGGVPKYRYDLIKIEGWEFGRRGEKIYELCDRCSGRGYMDEYRGIMGGTCFHCGKVGTGRLLPGGVEEAAAIARRIEADRQRILREEQQRQERHRAETAAWRAANTDIVDYFATRTPQTFTGWRERIGDAAYVVRSGGLLDDTDAKNVRRIIAKEAEYAQRDAQKAATSRHVAPVGDRIKKIPAKITRVHVLIGTRAQPWTNDQRWVTFEDADGNTLTWKTTADYDEDDAGRDVILSGTVKDHDDYRGIARTVLTRCIVNDAP